MIPPCSALAAVLALFALPASAQVVFTAPSTGGGLGLFEQRGSQIVALPSTQNEHYHAWISRSGRFVSFSSPDPTPPGAPPSSDLYVFDRVTQATNRVINYSTGSDGFGGFLTSRPIGSAVSPDGSLLAYGVVLQGSTGGATAAGRALNVVNLSNGLAAGPILGIKETPSDSLQAEFMGVSWDPGGNSFVTPTYITLGFIGGFPQELPAICRWTRQGNGSWVRSVLSSPQYYNSGFAAIYHIYPAVSPSGAGLAYFSINVPDLLGGTTPAQVSVVRANADGTNATVLGTFTPSGGDTFFPAGIDWSADGSRLVFSICQQVWTGTGWTTAANLGTGQVYSINSTTGQDFRAEPGLGGGIFPSIGPTTSFGSGSRPTLILGSDGSGGFVLTATGLDAGTTYQLRSSTSLDAGSFGSPANFTGQQLMDGITVSKVGDRRFFQLFEP